MDLGIASKKALVCGASQGIGRAIAEALAAEGARVFMTARSADTLKSEADKIAKATKAEVNFHACDLSNAASRNELIAAVTKLLGGVDILVHNTGGPPPTHVEDTTAQQWQQGFDSLFQSVVHFNQTFVPDMKKQRWGRIINITSLSVVEPISNLAVSNALRSAVTAMLKTLSDELAPFEITVNCVAPGSIATGRIDKLVHTRAEKKGVEKDEYMKEYIAAIPMGRLGTPEEFAAVVCFLASKQASYLTGSTICIDGGKRRSTY